MTKVPTKKSIIPAKKKAPPPPPPKKGVTKALLPTAASKKAAPVAAKPKKTAAKVDGRMFRKYTKASLFQTFTSTPVGEIRARIASSGAVAPEGLPGLSLKEVLAYLEVIENVWKRLALVYLRNILPSTFAAVFFGFAATGAAFLLAAVGRSAFVTPFFGGGGGGAFFLAGMMDFFVGTFVMMSLLSFLLRTGTSWTLRAGLRIVNSQGRPERSANQVSYESTASFLPASSMTMYGSLQARNAWVSTARHSPRRRGREVFTVIFISPSHFSSWTSPFTSWFPEPGVRRPPVWAATPLSCARDSRSRSLAEGEGILPLAPFELEPVDLLVEVPACLLQVLDLLLRILLSGPPDVLDRVAAAEIEVLHDLDALHPARVLPVVRGVVDGLDFRCGFLRAHASAFLVISWM
jgi:hypothetical protein